MKTATEDALRQACGGSADAEALLREALRYAYRKLADQQAIHEHEMEQDGRARATLIALCRELGVAIHTDAAEGIRAEFRRLRKAMR